MKRKFTKLPITASSSDNSKMSKRVESLADELSEVLNKLPYNAIEDYLGQDDMSTLLEAHDILQDLSYYLGNN